MKISLRIICLMAVGLPVAAVHAAAAGTGFVSLVKPAVPPATVDADNDGEEGPACGKGLVLQKNGTCCPSGTNNSVWETVCTPAGTIENQLFNGPDGTRYCPSDDMFIVSDKDRNWVSCAASNSTAMYTAAKKSAGSEFCMEHGYGYLIKVKPWGTVGCIKVEESQGDGCIEAGSCSFTGDK